MLSGEGKQEGAGKGVVSWETSLSMIPWELSHLEARRLDFCVLVSITHWLHAGCCMGGGV